MQFEGRESDGEKSKEGRLSTIQHMTPHVSQPCSAPNEFSTLVATFCKWPSMGYFITSMGCYIAVVVEKTENA